MNIEGIVLVDKPAGPTSHDVVAKMRKLFNTRKVGHAGTLDPMATGMLVIGIGRATRLLDISLRTIKNILGQSDSVSQQQPMMPKANLSLKFQPVTSPSLKLLKQFVTFVVR